MDEYEYDDIKSQIEKALSIKDMAKITSLLNSGVDINNFKIVGKTDVLLEAIVNKKIIFFNNMLSRGFDPINNEFLYLHHCVRTNELRYVKALLKVIKHNQLYLNKTDPSTGDTALHVATSQILDNNIVLELSRANLNWNAKNHHGQTPLHNLLRNYLLLEEKLIDEIFNKQADFKIKDKMNISPLDIIKSFGLDEGWRNSEQTKYLLNKLYLYLK